MTHLPESSAVPFAASSESDTKVLLPHSAATACISTATSRGVLGPLSGDDSCKPLVQFKGWLECNKTVLKADQDERHTLRNKYTQQHRAPSHLLEAIGEHLQDDQRPLGSPD